MMVKFEVQSSSRTDFIDITSQVAEAVRKLAINDGAVVVFNPHTTAGVTINEGADPDVVTDMTRALDKLIPWDDGYRHAEGNAAAHIKASLMGSSVTVLVENGELKLGTWQSLYFCCFDGPRRRQVWVKPV